MIILNLLAIIYAAAPGASPQLQHATWYGVTVYDLIFPTFVALSGCGMAFAYARPVTAWTTLRRIVVLMVVGLAYNAVLDRVTNPAELRLTGPLQLYAVLTLIVALLHRWVRSARAWALLTVVWSAALTALFVLHDRGCDLGHASRECNLSAATDLQWIPSGSLYRDGTAGHDPEGIITILGAMVTLSVGITAGRIIARPNTVPPQNLAARLLGWALATGALGGLLTIFVEPYKRLWTPSFGLLTGSMVVAVLLVGWLLHDAMTARATEVGPVLDPRWSTPVIAAGRNPLLLYFGSHLALNELRRWGEKPGAFTRLVEMDWPWGHPVTTLALGFTVAWVVVASVLHRRGIYVRA